MATLPTQPPLKRPHLNESSAQAMKSASGVEQDAHTWEDYIHSWICYQQWPRSFFEESEEESFAMNPIQLKQSSKSLRQKRPSEQLSDSASKISSTLVAKGITQYAKIGFWDIFSKAGSYGINHTSGLTEGSLLLCQELSNRPQITPVGTIFDDTLVRDAIRRLELRNEARIVKDITPLIVPWVETYALLNRNESLDLAIESVNERWNYSKRFEGLVPFPDYAAGISISAFSSPQRRVLDLMAGVDETFYQATYHMTFPFLTCEVKRAAGDLHIADRQNACSMTVAIRSVVELYRKLDRVCQTNRVVELHRQVIAFSISHNDKYVRIFAHYPRIQGKTTTYWRHEILPLGELTFVSRDNRWTSYKFVKNIYDVFLPLHFARIVSALDAMCAVESFFGPEVDDEADDGECSSFGTPVTGERSVCGNDTEASEDLVEDPLAADHPPAKLSKRSDMNR